MKIVKRMEISVWRRKSKQKDKIQLYCPSSGEENRLLDTIPTLSQYPIQTTGLLAPVNEKRIQVES